MFVWFQKRLAFYLILIVMVLFHTHYSMLFDQHQYSIFSNFCLFNSKLVIYLHAFFIRCFSIRFQFIFRIRTTTLSNQKCYLYLNLNSFLYSELVNYYFINLILCVNFCLCSFFVLVYVLLCKNFRSLKCFIKWLDLGCEQVIDFSLKLCCFLVGN